MLALARVFAWLQRGGWEEYVPRDRPRGTSVHKTSEVHRPTLPYIVFAYCFHFNLMSFYPLSNRGLNYKRCLDTKGLPEFVSMRLRPENRTGGQKVAGSNPVGPTYIS
jgi:hypothetical protein